MSAVVEWRDIWRFGGSLLVMTLGLAVWNGATGWGRHLDFTQLTILAAMFTVIKAVRETRSDGEKERG